MRTLGVLFIALTILVAMPHVQASECNVAQLVINFPSQVHALQVLKVTSRVTIYCWFSTPPPVLRVDLRDGNSTLLSASTIQYYPQAGDSNNFYFVSTTRVPNETAYHSYEVQAYILDSTGAVIQQLFLVYVYGGPVPIAGNYTEPPCHGKRCR